MRTVENWTGNFTDINNCYHSFVTKMADNMAERFRYKIGGNCRYVGAFDLFGVSVS